MSKKKAEEKLDKVGPGTFEFMGEDDGMYSVEPSTVYQCVYITDGVGASVAIPYQDIQCLCQALAQSGKYVEDTLKMKDIRRGGL